MTTQTEQTAASNPEKTNVARRIAPAVCLFFLAPLIAEYLLGDLPIKLLIALVFLAPLYGGGALLIRESVRRAGRGWPTIILLGLAYAIVEEAFTTQSLFNPDYLKLKMHLLDPAYIPALGIGGWWTMLMLNLHAAWSIATPIVLIEAAFPQRANKPWLGRTGYFVTALIFVAGATAATVTQIKRDPFMASHLQLATSALLVLILIAAAFLLPRRGPRGTGWVPGPWLAGFVALACGSAMRIPPRWGWGAAGAMLVVDLMLVGAVLLWSGRTAWDERHKLALGAGAALAYAWYSFIQVPVVGGATTSARIGNVIFAAGAVWLIWFAARRTSAALRQVNATTAP